ncbi:MAG: hypothetical protein U9R57_12370 [Thermodesulfobacteriota bacterium]|nr:hypothetical protein [Thermodesulfobacteriota bacterium]
MSESSIITDNHWQDLSTIIQRSPLVCTSLLKQPAPASAPPLSSIRQLLKFCTSRQQKQLLHRHIFSAIVLCKKKNYQQEELQQTCRLDKIFPDITPDTIHDSSWIAVPLPVIREHRAVKIHMLLGLKPGNGKCIMQTEPQLGSSSRETLELLVPDDKDLLVLTMQHNSDSPLSGRSLGLPAAIGISLLQNGRPWPPQLLATGALTTDGAIRAVQHIRKKKGLLSKDGGLFFVPVHNNKPDYDDRLIAVRTVKEAISVVNHLHRGIPDSQTIRLFQLAAQDADSLLERFHELPVEFFTLHDLAAVYKTIRNSPEKYSKKLVSCLDNKNNLTPLPDKLVSLFSYEDIWNLAQLHPFRSLEYSLAQLSFQNHFGRTDKSGKWSRLADKIAVSCDARQELSSLANNDFVNTRFNRYDFRPEIPELFKRRLEHEKQLHELQEDGSWQLGAMYGTIAQNFGFCGPAYLADLQEMCKQAIAAFGRRFGAEHPRIYSYLLYGLLENNRYNEANTLFSKMYSLPEKNPESWIQTVFAERSSHQCSCPFTITLLCRLLAEQPKFLDICSWRKSRQQLSRRVLQENRHPWQLSAVNLARCCLFYKEKNQAAKLLNHAVSICSRHGATMRAMGLLPLAVLHNHALQNASHISLVERIISEIRNHNKVRQSHFAELFQCKGGEHVLALVKERKKVLFPFSYR